jgi:uncharacterized membrane protein YbhN (UPF0104 family)
MSRRRLITVAALLLAGATALLAVPGLHEAARKAGSVRLPWLLGAVGLELASCVSFLAIFRRFFGELPAAEARRLAWIEMGSGALLPGGGVGSLAAGGLLLRRAGMSTRQIVERSSGLFFLTTGTNVIALESAALLLAVGVGRGPHGLLLTLLPAAVGLAGTAIVLAIPWSQRHRPIAPAIAPSRGHRRRRYAAVSSLVEGIRQAERELLRGHWRLLGALGYLGFDVGVLGLTCAGVGLRIGLPALVLAYIIGYGANSLPVPGGIGVLEGGLVGALVLYGAPAMPATAAVLLYHTIAFWIPSLGGAFAYLLTSMARRAGADRVRARAPQCHGRARGPATPRASLSAGANGEPARGPAAARSLR